MKELFGTIIGGGISAGLGALNNYLAEQRTEQDRRENYMYGEMAANAADARTRALYKDFYSPAALLRQYREAGLSPSLMFGGTPGQGGASGAQGSGAAGISTPYMPLSMIEGAQIANLAATTEKTKAETANIKTDTERQEIQKGMEQLQAGQYKTEWQILNSTWTENGQTKSIFEAARDHYSYESFLEWCRGENTDEVIKEATSTEAGQRILRNIYMGANHFNHDIMVLSEETVAASFQMSIVQTMQKTNFADLNAQAAIGYLRQNIETTELTTTQKEAWNNLIDRLGKKGSTTRDIIVVLGMILNQAASNWKMPGINITNRYNSTTTNNYEK